MTTDQDATKAQLCESLSLLRFLKGEGLLKGAEVTQRQQPPPAWATVHDS